MIETEIETKPKRKPQVPRDQHGLTPAAVRMHQGMLRLADADGLVHMSAARLCQAVGVSQGHWHLLLKAILAARLLQLARPGAPQEAAVYRVFAQACAGEFPPLPRLPPTSRYKPPPKVAAVKPARAAAAEVKRHVPLPTKVKRHPKTGAILNPWVIGSAEQYAIGTADERIAKVDEAERARIAAQYGARFVGRAA